MTIPLRRRLFYFFLMVRRLVEDVAARLGVYGHRAMTPHAIKRRVVREYAALYGTVEFVETGTYLGEMIASVLPQFDRLYTIELSDVLFEKAATRFARHANVQILHGDSATQLDRVLAECKGPTLFWLDAHWSGGQTARAEIETPIIAELDQIFRQLAGRSVILIDDARLFVAGGDYPTIEDLRQRVARWRPDHTLTVDRDIIRIVPPLSL
jgi:hypothetical protein